MWKLKDITYLSEGPPPSLLVTKWSGVELPLLVVPLGQILHVSMKHILDLTGADF
jgi:hypothetical protein